MQPSPPTGLLSLRSGNKEHRGRPPQPPICSTNIRTVNSERIFQPSEEAMVEDRCVCSIQQPSTTTTILEPTRRPICTADRCISTRLAEERFVHVPALETDTTNFEEIEVRQDQRSNSGNSSVGNTVLVYHAPEDETTQSTHHVENKSLDPDRMALVNKKRKDLGIYGRPRYSSEQSKQRLGILIF